MPLSLNLPYSQSPLHSVGFQTIELFFSRLGFPYAFIPRQRGMTLFEACSTVIWTLLDLGKPLVATNNYLNIFPPLKAAFIILMCRGRSQQGCATQAQGLQHPLLFAAVHPCRSSDQCPRGISSFPLLAYLLLCMSLHTSSSPFYQPQHAVPLPDGLHRIMPS